MVTVVLSCSDHLIRRDPILDPCFQSRVMNGKPLGRSATQPSWNCEYKIMGDGSMSYAGITSYTGIQSLIRVISDES